VLPGGASDFGSDAVPRFRYFKNVVIAESLKNAVQGRTL
jgi:hypothetical protein